jgi:hypothetical protein
MSLHMYTASSELGNVNIFSLAHFLFFIHSLAELTALSEVIHVDGKMTIIHRSRVPQFATHLFSQVSC